jgi:transcriptional regulator with XRE-family HTH domain
VIPGSERLGFHEGTRAARTIRRLRNERELSQADLAAKLGKTVSWVGHRETGAVRLRRDDAEKIAAELGTDFEGLTGGAA